MPVLGAIGFAVVLLGVGGVLTGHTASDANPAAMPVALAAGFTPLGVFVLRRRPGHPVGRLMLAAGLVASIAALSVPAWSTWVPAAWLSQWAWWPPLGAVPILLLLVPDGRMPSPRWWPLAAALVGAAGIGDGGARGRRDRRADTLLSDAERAPGPVVRVLLDIALLAVDRDGRRLARRPRGAGRPVAGGRAARAPAARLPAPVLVLLGVAVALDWVDVPYGGCRRRSAFRSG